MKRKIIFTFLLGFYNVFVFSQNKLHNWYESNILGVEFNKDQSKVLIVGYDCASLWNTKTGALIKSMQLTFNDKPIEKKAFQFIDASPDLSEFIFKVNNSYRRFLLDIEDVDLFPDFQKRRVKQIIGYDKNGWLVFFSEGFYQGFYRVKQEGNVSNLEFLSTEYISNASISNDHNHILFSRDRTFRYLNLTSKKVTDTKLPAYKWKDNHLPKGYTTLYQWNGNEKEGKQITWRYFIELGNEPSKKLKGKHAQSAFMDEGNCKKFPFYTFGTTKNGYWEMVYSNKDDGQSKTTYQFALYKKNKSDCKQISKINFSKSFDDHNNKKQQSQNKYFAKVKEEKLKEQALKPIYFKEYLSKFPKLSSPYKLDYNNISGTDITNTIFVQKEKYRLGNPNEFAIGKILNCSNGNVAVLRMTRRIKNGMDRSSFRIFTYNNLGQEINQQKIAESQKFNGQFPIISFFTISTNQNSWKANVTVNHQNGKVTKNTFQGNCN